MSALPSFRAGFSSLPSPRATRTPARAPVPELPIALQPGAAPMFGFSRASPGSRLRPLPLQLLHTEPSCAKRPRATGAPSPASPPLPPPPLPLQHQTAVATPCVEIVEDSTGRAPPDVLSSAAAPRSLNTSFSARTAAVPSTAPHTLSLSLSHGPTRSDLSHLLRHAASSASAAAAPAQPAARMAASATCSARAQLGARAAWPPTRARSNTLPALASVPFDDSSEPLPPPPHVALTRAGASGSGGGSNGSNGSGSGGSGGSDGSGSNGSGSVKNRNGGDERKTVQCEHCGRWLRNQVTLQNHIRVVHLHSGTFQCSQCESTFMWQSTLGNHVRLVHEKQKPFGCAQCGKAFRWNSHLREHLSVVHRGEKPFRCDTCGKRFGRKNNMQKHVRKHREREQQRQRQRQ